MVPFPKLNIMVATTNPMELLSGDVDDPIQQFLKFVILVPHRCLTGVP